MTDDTGRISRRSALALGPAAVAALALDGTDAMAQAAPDAPPPARAHGRPWKIAFEEHFLTSDFNPFPPSMQAALAGRSGAELQPVVRKLLEVGDARLALMDAAGIEYSILSLNTPGLQGESNLRESVRRARKANDDLKAITQKHPRRFGGFAALPTQDPVESANELERCVRQLGFHGALINSFATIGEAQQVVFLDDPRYDILWERAVALGCPIYLHPRNMLPNQSLIFDGRPELLAATWGYLVECSTHALRMIAGGVFDRFPALCICMGHLGEALPANQWRIGETYRLKFGKGPLKRPFSDYIKSNFVYTTGGFFDTIALKMVVETVGLDRVCFSTDYPWMDMSSGSNWFDTAAISAHTRERIGRGNALRLFNIKLDDAEARA